MKISSSSVWTLPELSQFLSDELIPIRLAVMNGEFPLVCSVWFQWDPTTNSILCASHENQRGKRRSAQNGGLCAKLRRAPGL